MNGCIGKMEVAKKKKNKEKYYNNSDRRTTRQRWNNASKNGIHGSQNGFHCKLFKREVIKIIVKNRNRNKNKTCTKKGLNLKDMACILILKLPSLHKPLTLKGVLIVDEIKMKKGHDHAMLNYVHLKAHHKLKLIHMIQ